MVISPNVFILILMLTCNAYCETRHVIQKQISHGYKSFETEFPFQVAIYFKNYFNCGGIIVSETKILTAGHCIVYREDCSVFPLEEFFISAGSAKLSKQKDYLVERIALHPNFTWCGSNGIKNDFALIFLEHPLPLHLPYIKAIELQDKHVPINSRCIITGWGRVRNRQIPFTNTLRTGIVRITAIHECEKHYGFIEDKSMICAGLHDPVSPCQGDSGGPLICNGLATGIVSFGGECIPGVPAAYSNISAHAAWINSDCTPTHQHSFRNILFIILVKLFVVD